MANPYNHPFQRPQVPPTTGEFRQSLTTQSNQQGGIGDQSIQSSFHQTRSNLYPPTGNSFSTQSGPPINSNSYNPSTANSFNSTPSANSSIQASPASTGSIKQVSSNNTTFGSSVPTHGYNYNSPNVVPAMQPDSTSTHIPSTRPPSYGQYPAVNGAPLQNVASSSSNYGNPRSMAQNPPPQGIQGTSQGPSPGYNGPNYQGMAGTTPNYPPMTASSLGSNPMSPTLMQPSFGAPPQQNVGVPSQNQNFMPTPNTGQSGPGYSYPTPPQPNAYPNQPKSFPPANSGYPSQYGTEGYAARGPPQPQGGNQVGKQRIDPAQIPRPIIQREPITYVARGHTLSAPPAASADYVAIDHGCCSPRFIRPTLNHVPQTREIAKHCEIPFAAVLCPLANLENGEEEVPVIDFGPEGPLRCQRCKAYINCFTTFVQGGKKFICNICSMSNEVPRDYYCSVDEHGRRRDFQERAELSRGSVEFLVPKEYMIRPAQEHIFVFVLDVSVYSLQNGLLMAALDTIKEVVLELPESDRTKIGIVTFDKRIQYYKVNAKQRQPEVLICSDIDDPFSPLPSHCWLMPLKEAREDVEIVCDHIAELFADTKVPDGAAGSAINSVILGLSAIGGKILLFQSALPKIGVGKVVREEAMRVYGTDHEKELYCSDSNDKFYQKLALECANQQVSVDIYIAGRDYADVATIGQLCSKTGGQFLHMPHFGKDPYEDALKIKQEIKKCISEIRGFEAVLKVRCSTGLRVENHYGNFLDRNGLGQEVEIAAVHCNQSVVVTFAHDDDLSEGSDVYIQAALLYTTVSGRRCVRVHNLALQVAPLLSNVFRYADLEAAVSVYLRQGIEQMKEKDLNQVRDQHLNNCVNVLHNYRKFCASASSSGQLILPESLKLLPLYTLAMIKSLTFRSNASSSGTRSGVDVKVDERAYLLMLVNSIRAEHAISMIYPRMYGLHDMLDECGTIGSNGKVILPSVLPPTAEHLCDEGIFLLVSSCTLHMYIGAKAPIIYLQDMFGVEAVDTSELVVSLSSGAPNEYKQRIERIVQEIRSKHPIHLQLEIVTRSDWRSGRFMSLLVEDRTKNDMSYVEFLCQIHKKIQTRFQ